MDTYIYYLILVIFSYVGKSLSLNLYHIRINGSRSWLFAEEKAWSYSPPSSTFEQSTRYSDRVAVSNMVSCTRKSDCPIFSSMLIMSSCSQLLWFETPPLPLDSCTASLMLVWSSLSWLSNGRSSVLISITLHRTLYVLFLWQPLLHVKIELLIF